MSSFVHGSKAGFRLGTAATPTTLVDVSAYFNSISFPQSRDTAETTTFTKSTKSYVPGLRDATFSAEGRFTTAVDTHLNALMSAGEVNFEYAPAGLGVAGTPLYAGKLFATSYEGSSDIGDVGAVSIEFQCSGDVSRSIQS